MVLEPEMTSCSTTLTGDAVIGALGGYCDDEAEVGGWLHTLPECVTNTLSLLLNLDETH